MIFLLMSIKIFKLKNHVFHSNILLSGTTITNKWKWVIRWRLRWRFLWPANASLPKAVELISLQRYAGRHLHDAVAGIVIWRQRRRRSNWLQYDRTGGGGIAVGIAGEDGRHLVVVTSSSSLNRTGYLQVHRQLLSLLVVVLRGGEGLLAEPGFYSLLVVVEEKCT